MTDRDNHTRPAATPLAIMPGTEPLLADDPGTRTLVVDVQDAMDLAEGYARAAAVPGADEPAACLQRVWAGVFARLALQMSP